MIAARVRNGLVAQAGTQSRGIEQAHADGGRDAVDGKDGGHDSEAMIDIEDSPDGNAAGACTRLVVQGNCSMSWHANLWLAASLGLVCMGIAVALATFGLWLVIPFAGLEILLIVSCLYLTQRRLSRKEVITVSGEAVRLEWGYTRPDISVDLPRQWTRLRFRDPDSPFDTGELSVAAHGCRYALGSCLNKEEKKLLHTELAAALRRPRVTDRVTSRAAA